MAKSVEEMRAEYARMNRRTIPEPQTTEAGSPLAPPILESELACHMKRCPDCPGGGCLRGAVMTMRQAGAFMGREWAERMGDPDPHRWPSRPLLN